MPQAPAPAEQSVILHCLSAIRWRLFSVRLAERVAVALAWGGAMALASDGCPASAKFPCLP